MFLSHADLRKATTDISNEESDLGLAKLDAKQNHAGKSRRLCKIQMGLSLIFLLHFGGINYKPAFP